MALPQLPAASPAIGAPSVQNTPRPGRIVIRPSNNPTSTGNSVSSTTPRASNNTQLAAVLPFITTLGSNGRDANNLARIKDMNATSDGLAMTFNNTVQQCAVCGQWQADETALKSHQKAHSHHCRRCNRVWYTCGEPVQEWNNYPYCVYSCGVHNKCFAGLPDMHDHANTDKHSRCFFDRCLSDARFGQYTDEQVVRHVFSQHRSG